MTRTQTMLAWVAQLVAGGILGLAGLMKLMAQPASIALFQELGAEPWGRYLVGLAELTAAVLLLIPATAARGGILALVLMAGAMGTHLFRIGINYNGDGGSLFGMAVTVAMAAGAVALLRGRTDRRVDG